MAGANKDYQPADVLQLWRESMQDVRHGYIADAGDFVWRMTHGALELLDHLARDADPADARLLASVGAARREIRATRPAVPEATGTADDAAEVWHTGT
jgi:hypothetical protein